jgi:predicted phage terminase large subunit-like protein
MTEQTAARPGLAEIAQTVADSPHLLGRMLGYKRLGPIHSEWIKRTIPARRDVTLMAHRGSYKTTAVTVLGCIWWLLFNPNARILICSSTDTNAGKILGEIEAHYRGDALRALYALFDVPEPRGGAWRNDSITLATRTEVRKEGSIECVGVGGTVTSRHYDLIVCDDLVTLKDRYSHAIREQKKGWVKELQSIKDPGGHIVYVGTPWHKDDVYSILPEPRKYPLGSVEIDGLTAEAVAEIRRLQGESFFSAQYLLEHVADEDRIFDSPRFGPAPAGLRLSAYLDPAYGGADYSAMAIGGKVGEVLHVVAGSIWRAKVDETYSRVEAACRAAGVTVLYVESNNAQGLIFSDEFQRRGLAVHRVYNTTNKHLRIVSSLRTRWASIVFAPEVDEQFMGQVLEYTETAEHDDAPDALAGLVEAFFKRQVRAARSLWG